MACRTPRPKRELVRIVRTPDGRIAIDESGRVAGRGAYLCADAACWRNATTKGALERALATALPAELRLALEAGRTDRMMTEGGVRGQE